MSISSESTQLPSHYAAQMHFCCISLPFLSCRFSAIYSACRLLTFGATVVRIQVLTVLPCTDVSLTSKMLSSNALMVDAVHKPKTESSLLCPSSHNNIMSFILLPGLGIQLPFLLLYSPILYNHNPSSSQLLRLYQFDPHMRFPVPINPPAF